MKRLACGSWHRDIDLQPFFDTVAIRLENTLRGSRFPLLQGRLHDGYLPARQAQAALAELSQIEQSIPPPPLLRQALETAVQSGRAVTLRNPQQLTMAIAVTGAGLLWCLAIARLYPHWLIVSAVIPIPNDGIPVWRGGFVLIAMGLAYITDAAVPALGYWFRRRQWALAALAILGALALATISPVPVR